MRPVLVVSHADADGHVIAEQVSRNCRRAGFDVNTVVDPSRTKDHKTWTKLEGITEIEDAEIVLFVDLMFAPSSYAAEAQALVDFAVQRPQKRFFVLDHHPVPKRLLERAANLHSAYRRDVVDCTFGTPSWLMGIAALLEKQPTRVREVAGEHHRLLAEGIRRAAAPGGGLAGPKLLALLRAECWDALVALGRDERSHHRLPRGRRPRVWQPSAAMEELDALASRLLRPNTVSRRGQPTQEGKTQMSYDLEFPVSSIASKADVVQMDGSDLETIVILLELAAISLTSKPGDTFTNEQLLAEARELGGRATLESADVDIVLEKASFLKKERKRQYSLK
jgi:hypothetical protein